MIRMKRVTVLEGPAEVWAQAHHWDPPRKRSCSGGAACLFSDHCVFTKCMRMSPTQWILPAEGARSQQVPRVKQFCRKSTIPAAEEGRGRDIIQE